MVTSTSYATSQNKATLATGCCYTLVLCYGADILVLLLCWSHSDTVAMLVTLWHRCYAGHTLAPLLCWSHSGTPTSKTVVPVFVVLLLLKAVGFEQRMRGVFEGGYGVGGRGRGLLGARAVCVCMCVHVCMTGLTAATL